MEEIQKLKQLVEYGIPASLIARECHCSPSTIWNYTHDTSIPTGPRTLGIKDGLSHLLKQMKAIIGE